MPVMHAAYVSDKVYICSLAVFFLCPFIFGSGSDQYVKPYLHRLYVTHWTCLNMWPLGLFSNHVPHGLVVRKGRRITQALPRQRIRTRIEIPSITEFVYIADSSSRFYFFCSSLPLRSCSQCASISQCLIFLSINQRKAPCVRHALWVSARPEWIHIYSNV